MPKLIGRMRALLVLAGLATCASLAAESSDPLRVDTDTGVLRGIQGKGVREFKGIPFALPPIGDLRFSPPVPQTRWAGTLDATQYKSRCPQVSRFGQTDASDNEDWPASQPALPACACS